MRDSISRSLVLLLVTAIAGAAVFSTVFNSKAMTQSTVENGTNSHAQSPGISNPLLLKWEGPYGGVPAFDRVQIALFKPALEAAMAEQLTEIDRIAADPAAPTFQNTLEALEKVGSTLNRVGAGLRSLELHDEQCRLSSG